MYYTVKPEELQDHLDNSIVQNQLRSSSGTRDFISNSMSTEQVKRYKHIQTLLIDLAKRRGAVYVLGLCIGMLSRRASSDYDLYNELETRAKDDRTDY